MTLALKAVRNEAMRDDVLAGRMAYWVELFRWALGLQTFKLVFVSAGLFSHRSLILTGSAVMS
jgi:hypothetical protein